MAFTVPNSEPAASTGLVAGDWITAASMNNLVQRDRFVFATRRRLIASIGKVVTSSATFEAVRVFRFITLSTATDTLLIGVTADGNCDVMLNIVNGPSGSVNTGGAGCIIGALSGVPIYTWSTAIVLVGSRTGGPVTIFGINIQEQILTAADLP